MSLDELKQTLKGKNIRDMNRSEMEELVELHISGEDIMSGVITTFHSPSYLFTGEVATMTREEFKGYVNKVLSKPLP